MFEYGHKLPEFNDISKKLDQLNEEEKILKTSYEFLKFKLEDFKKNGKLNIDEWSFIGQQIYYHKRLAILKKNYLVEKKNLSNLSIKKINTLYSIFEASEITNLELKNLKNKLKSEKRKTKDTIFPFGEKTFRDLIEKNINFKWFPESLKETQSIKKFYHEFTIKYLNIIEKEEPVIKSSKGLQIHKDQVIEIIIDILDENPEIFKGENPDIKVTINGKAEIIKFKKIRKTIEKRNIQAENARNFIKETLENERKLKEKIEIINQSSEINDQIKKIYPLISISTHINGSENLDELISKFSKQMIRAGSLTNQEVLEIISNQEKLTKKDKENLKTEIEKIFEFAKIDKEKLTKEKAIGVLDKLINLSNKKHEINKKAEKKYTYNEKLGNSIDGLIKSMIESGEISKNEILLKLQYKENGEEYISFNYLNFIEKFGLPEEVINGYTNSIYLKMLNKVLHLGKGKKIKMTPEYIEENYAKIVNNITVLNKIILGIESEGWNKDNTNGSGAKCLYQFHTKNGGKGRKYGEYHSFDTALRRSFDYSIDKFISELSLRNKDYILSLKKDLEEKHSKLSERIKIENKNNPSYNDIFFIKKLYSRIKSNKRKEKLIQPGGSPVPKWIINAYNNKIDPKTLSASKQNLLFLFDANINGKEVGRYNSTALDFLALAYNGSIWSIEEFYKTFHHTDPDEQTKKRMKKYVDKYRKEFINLTNI